MEPEPINHCEVNETSCEGDDVSVSRLAQCYPCGLSVCRAPGCSRLVRYKIGFGRVRRVRACENCIEERTPWGVFPDLSEEVRA